MKGLRRDYSENCNWKKKERVISSLGPCTFRLALDKRVEFNKGIIE